jgi:hypothetical protein
VISACVAATLLGGAACGTTTEPDNVPSVSFTPLLGRPYRLEELPPPVVSVRAGAIHVILAEWFSSHGFSLRTVSQRYRPPEGLYTSGSLSLNVESRSGVGIGLIWRMDTEITITPLPPGPYYIRIVRYDPDILPSLHPFGNPRLPVDTLVTVP